MPEVHFKVTWPDGDTAVYYSPSTIIHQYFEPTTRYPLEDFLVRVEDALEKASERVRERYGFYCSSAAAEREKIRAKALQLKNANTDGEVTVSDLLTG